MLIAYPVLDAGSLQALVASLTADPRTLDGHSVLLCAFKPDGAAVEEAASSLRAAFGASVRCAYATPTLRSDVFRENRLFSLAMSRARVSSQPCVLWVPPNFQPEALGPWLYELENEWKKSGAAVLCRSIGSFGVPVPGNRTIGMKEILGPAVFPAGLMTRYHQLGSPSRQMTWRRAFAGVLGRSLAESVVMAEALAPRTRPTAAKAATPPPEPEPAAAKPVVSRLPDPPDLSVPDPVPDDPPALVSRRTYRKRDA